MSNIPENVVVVRQRVAAAARRGGRDPAAVTIIAVTKTRTVDEVRQVLATGLTDLGENRVQELKEKWTALGGTAATWHVIGSLQTNKAKQAMEMASLVHSLDREALADEFARVAERDGKLVDALVQVNVSGEGSKHGIAAADLVGFLRRISERGQIRVHGLMTMAPLDADAEQSRPHFRRLRLLAAEAQRLALPGIDLKHLSMGMSGDYEVAVEEGATLVRIGTAIFGTRQ